MLEKENELKQLRRDAMHRAQRLRSFYQSLLLFIVVNLLIALNIYLPEKYNVGYVWFIIIWALFLIYQALKYFSGFWIFSNRWEEKQVTKYMKKYHPSKSFKG